MPDRIMLRAAQAKWAFTTRRVDRSMVRGILNDSGVTPSAGDLVLARVTEVGQHTGVELPTGRRAAIHPGTEIVVSYGNRYAPDQFEALVPGDLGPAQLVAGGGIASRVTMQHDRMKDATAIEPLGLLTGDDGKPLNLRSFALKRKAAPAIPAIAVFGTSMNAGKTTTVASIVRGLSRAGFRVGAAKVTGTGAGNDLWTMIDAGACAAYDFTDAGFATTYLTPIPAILDGAATLLSALAADGAEIAVIEIADGLFQMETARLAADPRFRSMVVGAVFAAGDSMGAAAGASHLASLGHEVLALSGLVTRSPLGTREAATTGLPVLTPQQLADPDVAGPLFGHLLQQERQFARAG